MFLSQLKKKSSKRRRYFIKSFEDRLLFSVLLSGTPGILLGCMLLWFGSYSIDHKIEGTLLVVFLWFGLGISARNFVVHSIRVLSNVVSSLKEEDFSFRATKAVPGDALGELAIEINFLARALEEERLGAMEATQLLRKVMTEAGAVIFAFSPDGRVRLVNRAGVAFLGKNEEQILNRKAEELGIQDLIEGPPSETISRFISNLEKRWIVRRNQFWQHGICHQLVVLSEASEALRAEERSAWQRIIRVLGHEINNSLAPIKSIARTLARLSQSYPLPHDADENLQHGLGVIGDRAESLNRFLQKYGRLAKVPPPSKRITGVVALIQRVIQLEPRCTITIAPGPDIQIYADPDQLEQALINLIRNAVDAVLQKSGADPQPDSVVITWRTTAIEVDLWILDRGIGLPDTENMWVPFYTTKTTGSGIGLLLSRQIIEAHGGSLSLQNREAGAGCEVTVTLPLL